MKLKTEHRIIFFGGVLLILAGCASGPELDALPMREIDRPYTNPAHLADVVHRITFPIEGADNSRLEPITSSIQGSLGLSENWDLNLSIDPTIVFYPAYQFYYDETGYTGASLGLVVRPGINEYELGTKGTFSHRHKFSRAIAIDASALGTLNYSLHGNGCSWLLGGSIGPLFQLTDSISLLPFLALNIYNQGIIRSGYAEPFSPGTKVVFPVGVELGWIATKHFNFGLGYEYSRIGRPTGDFTHLITTSATLLW